MAECEVCGNSTRQELILVQIGGARMRVCPKCAKLGTEIRQPVKRTSQKGPISSPSFSAPKKRPRDVFDLMDGDIADDFSDRVRNARMEKGLSQKELALLIKEKEGLIKKIESGLVPEDGVRKKIENALQISLLDSFDDNLISVKKKGVTTTLGDVIMIRKDEK